MNKNDIVLIHGTDYKAMTLSLLEACDMASDIGDINQKIALKPNLVVAKSPSTGATTHAELLAGVIEYLQAHGFHDISIMEGSWVGDITQSAFSAAGYREISRKYQVPLIDLQQDSYQEYDAAGMKIKICDQAAAVDYMINMPVLKGHCQTILTCALKNNKGIMPNTEKRHFHTLGLNKPIAHLNVIAPNSFILVDNICGDLDFEEGGNPVTMNRIFACKDPVLCDSFVCDTMGYQIQDIPYIPMAEALGVGSSDTSKANFVYLNDAAKTTGKPKQSRRVSRLAEYADPKDACSACYGSLIYALDRLDSQGRLDKSLPPVCIGQGYRGETGTIGVGSCTCKFQKSLPGCPPKAIDMVHFLEEEWGQ